MNLPLPYRLMNPFVVVCTLANHVCLENVCVLVCGTMHQSVMCTALSDHLHASLERTRHFFKSANACFFKSVKAAFYSSYILLTFHNSLLENGTPTSSVDVAMQHECMNRSFTDVTSCLVSQYYRDPFTPQEAQGYRSRWAYGSPSHVGQKPFHATLRQVKCGHICVPDSNDTRVVVDDSGTPYSSYGLRVLFVEDASIRQVLSFLLRGLFEHGGHHVVAVDLLALSRRSNTRRGKILVPSC